MAARKRSRKTRRSRRQQPFNVVNAAELYLQTSVITNNIMGTNPLTALTGIEYGQTGTVGANSYGKGGTAVMGYSYMPSAASVTLPEVLGVGNATFGQGAQVMKANLQSNFVPLLIQSVGVRAGFAIGKKLMSKQRSFLNNKVLKPMGLARTVRV